MHDEGEQEKIQVRCYLRCFFGGANPPPYGRALLVLLLWILSLTPSDSDVSSRTPPVLLPPTPSALPSVLSSALPSDLLSATAAEMGAQYEAAAVDEKSPRFGPALLAPIPLAKEEEEEEESAREERSCCPCPFDDFNFAGSWNMTYTYRYMPYHKLSIFGEDDT